MYLFTSCLLWQLTKRLWWQYLGLLREEGGWTPLFSGLSMIGNWRRLRDVFTLQDKTVFPCQDDKLLLKETKDRQFSVKFVRPCIGHNQPCSRIIPFGSLGPLCSH